MAGKKRVLDIELELNGETKARFLEIKRAKGLTDDAEVLRLIINEYFGAISEGAQQSWKR